MALPKQGLYPHVVHYIPKDFLETLQMFGVGVLEEARRVPNVSCGGRPQWPKTLVAAATPALSSAGGP